MREKRGHWWREGPWLTAPSYNYTFCPAPDFFQPQSLLGCYFGLLFYFSLFFSHRKRRPTLRPPVTCLHRAAVIVNTVSAGKPNRAWHSTPSPDLMMSWCHKCPQWPHLPTSRYGEWCGVAEVGRWAKRQQFLGGWVVTGHVFKTPPLLDVVKVNQTIQHHSWLWKAGFVF